MNWSWNNPKLWIPSHILAVVTGWVLISTGNRQESHDQPGQEASTTPHKTKASRQREQLNRSNPAGRLVWNLLEEIDNPDTAEEFIPAKDRAAAARAAIDEWIKDGRDPKLLSEAKTRFGHWLETDPKAALLYWNGSGSSGTLVLAPLAEVARPYLETTSLRELKEWFKESQGLLTGAARDVMIDVFAKVIADNQDLSALEDALAEAPSQNSNRLVSQAIMAWPKEKLAAIEEFVRKNPGPQGLQAFVTRLDAEQRIEWIRHELRNQGDLAKILRESGMLVSIAYGATGTSVQERVNLLNELKLTVSASNLARGDVQRWLASTDGATDGTMSDWKHRLRQGEMGARQILDETRRALPTIAAEHPDEFRQTLFKQLAAIRPASAVDLISDLPMQQREAALLDAAMGVAGQADPQHLFELLSQMPPTLASKPNDRYQVWIRAAAPSYNKYGESYSAWVAAMPQGIERDWALSGLYANFQSYDPEKAESYRALKTMPPGWKPAK